MSAVSSVIPFQIYSLLENCFTWRYVSALRFMKSSYKAEHIWRTNVFMTFSVFCFFAISPVDVKGLHERFWIMWFVIWVCDQGFSTVERIVICLSVHCTEELVHNDLYIYIELSANLTYEPYDLMELFTKKCIY